MKTATKQTYFYFFDTKTRQIDICSKRPSVFSYFEKKWNPQCLPIGFVFIYGYKLSKNDFFTSRYIYGKTSNSEIHSQTSNSNNFSNIPKMSFIKSLLQKAIRRCDTQIALSAAKTFMMQNMCSFLRRLLIIAAEDVYCDERILLILVFFHKIVQLGFVPQESDCNLFLTIVGSLCKETRTISYGQTEVLDPINLTIPASIALQIYINSTTFVLQGDRRMMTWYHNEYAKGREFPIMTFDKSDFSQIELITKSKCPLYAIDFHNVPGIPISVHKMYPELSSNHIKTLIWEHRSGCNLRKPWTLKKSTSEWTKISKTVDHISQVELNK